jgi:hypothetical protein
MIQEFIKINKLFHNESIFNGNIFFFLFMYFSLSHLQALKPAADNLSAHRFY